MRAQRKGSKRMESLKKEIETQKTLGMGGKGGRKLRDGGKKSKGGA